MMTARLPFKLAFAATVMVLTYLLIPKGADSAFDMQGLNQQVQRHDETLDNHEARINNLENDTQAVEKVVIEKVGPVEKPVPTPVPQVTTPAPEPQPEPAPGPNTARTCTPRPCGEPSPQPLAD